MHTEGLKTPMVAEKLLTFPELDISAPQSSPSPPSGSNSTKSSLSTVLQSSGSSYSVSLLPPSSKVSSSPSFENLQSVHSGSDESDDSIEGEQRDQVSTIAESYKSESLRRRNQFQKQDSGMFSSISSSMEETRGNDVSTLKRKGLGRRRSDPHSYNKPINHSLNGSMSENSVDSSLILSRRDKTTGIECMTIVTYITFSYQECDAIFDNIWS